MSLELKDGAKTEGLPTITLAGVSYFVPRLRLRERIAISGLAPKVKALVDKIQTKDKAEGRAFLDEGDYLALVETVRLALVPFYPTITRDDLLDQEIELDELFTAYPVIIAQGSSRRAGAGEGTATSQTSASGEGSSPT